MKRKTMSLLLSSFLLFNLGCNNSSSSRNSSETDVYKTESEDNETIDDKYKDGTYCAEVEYYNPSTGTRNTYDLDVEVEGGDLTVIHWPNSGWLDNSHFNAEDITDGDCEFISDKGYRYTVTLGELGGCSYTDEYKIRRDVNAEVEETTCPICGEEKDAYDEYCYSCKIKINNDKENICTNCGTYEYGINGGLCSSCKQSNLENIIEENNDENDDN